MVLSLALNSLATLYQSELVSSLQLLAEVHQHNTILNGWSAYVLAFLIIDHFDQTKCHLELLGQSFEQEEKREDLEEEEEEGKTGI